MICKAFVMSHLLSSVVLRKRPLDRQRNCLNRRGFLPASRNIRLPNCVVRLTPSHWPSFLSDLTDSDMSLCVRRSSCHSASTQPSSHGPSHSTRDSFGPSNSALTLCATQSTKARKLFCMGTGGKNGYSQTEIDFSPSV